MILDAGLHRHLRFKTPGASSYYYDIVTWPGFLAVTGDMGTYVFSRLTDMFEFFMTQIDRYPERKQDPLDTINPSYWQQKLEGSPKEGVDKFDEEAFNKAVMEFLVTYIRENRHEVSAEVRRYLWDGVVDEIINADSSFGGDEKRRALANFRFPYPGNFPSFNISDLLERSFEEPSFHYLWICYAIVSGITQYREYKGAG
ncbi:hypothetical protein [Methylobacillus sp.]|uniref:hypothetical protein n=1 Tax=Methylobacillus sp. TaxID=56818 RepID=UPI0012C67292|nr:hypothetical protein [Methylobacillus sp.]MPS48507.1 hypothetical protein [Methylobacillus sp.]